MFWLQMARSFDLNGNEISGKIELPKKKKKVKNFFLLVKLESEEGNQQVSSLIERWEALQEKMNIDLPF